MRTAAAAALLMLLCQAASAECLLIDHRSTNLSAIPDYWIERAKTLTFHFAHTSHGSQIISGLAALQQENPKYAVEVRQAESAGLPESERSAIRIYDGNPPTTYVSPGDYWATPEGFSNTESVAATGEYDYSMWSWCGEQSENEQETVQEYLNAMDRLDDRHPGMRFILMSGHTDGGGRTLARNNQIVRDWCKTEDKVLYDFADIESWDPAGKYYPKGSDACEWCEGWCGKNPDDCEHLTDDCAHSHPYNCRLKASAFWWMAARLAGWDRLSQTSTATTIQGPGKTATTLDATATTTPSASPEKVTPAPSTTTPLVRSESEPNIIERIIRAILRLLGL